MVKTFYMSILVLLLCVNAGFGQVNPNSHLDKGLSLYQSQMWSAAKHEFIKAQKAINPDNVGEKMRVEFYVALCSSELGQSNAMELLQKFLKDYPNSIYNNDVRFAIAALDYKNGNWQKACTNLLSVNPFELSVSRQDEYNFKLAHSLMNIDDMDKAYSYFRQVSSQGQYAPHAAYYTAYIEYLRENYSEAKRGFKSLESNPAYEKIVPFYLLQIEFLQNNYQYVTQNGDALMNSATNTRAAEIARIMGESWFHLAQYAKALTYMDRYEHLGGVMGREENYLVGYAQYMTGSYNDAAAILALVCGVDDKLSQNAAYHLADSYLRLGDKRRAMQSFSMASEVNFDDVIREDALFNYGKLQYELGGGVFNEAINVLNRYINEYPSSKRIETAREYLISAYYNSKNYDAAYQAIKLIQNPDNNIRTALQKIAYFRALEYFNTGDTDMAYRLLEQSLQNKFNPKYTALTQFWMGEILYRNGEYARALPLFKQYVTLSPAGETENIVAAYNLGYCYFNTRQWDLARQWFEKFISRYSLRDNRLADAYNRMGDVIYSDRQYWKATEQYDEAIKIGTKEKYYAQYQRAVMLGLVDRAQRKIESLAEIISRGEGDYVDDAMYELGRTYVAAEQYAQGAAMLKRFVAEYPNSENYVKSLSELGLTYQNLGDNNQAMKYYKMVVAAAPQSAQAKDAMLGIQGIYVEDSDVDGYFDYAKQSGVQTDLGAVQRDSLSFLSAEKLYLAGDRVRAEKALDNYIRQNVNGVYQPVALYYLADCQIRENQTQAAMESLTKLSQLYYNEYTVRSLEKLSTLCFDTKQYEKSAESYRKLSEVAINPATVASALEGYLRSVAELNKMDVQLAAADYVLGVAAASQSVRQTAEFMRAKALDAGGNSEQAMNIYAKLSLNAQSAEGAESAYIVIESTFKSGDLKAAEQMVFKLSQQNTPQAYWLGKAFLVLGDIYISQGDNFQARATLQSIVDGYSPSDDGIVEAARERIKNLK